MGKWMGVDGQGVGCSSSRFNEELEISIVWGAALAADLIRSLRSQSSGEAALAVDYRLTAAVAADLIRSLR